MAVKYRIEFTSQVFRLPYRLDIYDNNYTGAPLVLNGANPPVAKRRDNDGIFFGTSLDIGMEVPVSMPWGITDLYSQTARDHKVELYRNGVLDWCGYLVPEEYSDPLIAPPFDIFLRAVDGIGTLKNFDFSIDINSEMVSQLTIIQHCLSKLDITLPLAICMNIWEDNHITSRSAIEQTYMSPSAFYDADGAPFSCDEVLQLIFNSYDTQIAITQEAGYWLITREIDAPTRSYICYNAAGAYTETKQFNNIVDFGSKTAYTASRCYPISSLSRNFFAQRKEFSIAQDYGLENNVFPYKLNKNAYIGTSAYNKDWEVKLYNNYEPAVMFEHPDGNALYIPAGLTCRCKAFDIAANAIDIKMTIPFAFVSSFIQSFDVQVCVRNNNKYLSENGWVDSEIWLTFTNAGLGELIPKRVSLTTLTLSMTAPDTGDFQVFFKSISAAYVIGQLCMSYLETGELTIPSGIDADVLINSSAIQSESVKCYGDVLNDVNSRLIYHNGFYLSTQMPTHLWKMSGDTESTSLLSILARSLASNFRTARQVYSGTLQGASLSLCSIIKDAANSNRQFICITASHNLLTDELEGDFRELLPFAEAEMTYSDDPVYSNSSKNNTTTNSSRDYIVFGGSVGVGKRIYQLPLANSTANKYIMIDAEGNEEAERTPYVEGMPKTLFDSMFELVPNSGNPYIKAKFDFVSIGGLTSFATEAPASIWDSLPIASASVLGGVKIGTGLTRAADGTISVSAMGSQVLSFDGTYLSISGGNSISLAALSPTWANVSGKPTTLAGYGITDAAVASHTHAFSALTSKPTTLAGYGITDAINRTSIDGEHQDTVAFSGFFRSNTFPLAQYIHCQHPLNAGYGFQLGNAYDDALRFRNKVAGVWGAYRTVWHDGNFTPSTNNISEGSNLYFTDARARAACASAGQVYDSARLGGVLVSSYTRRDVNESITGAWSFNGLSIARGQAAYTELQTLAFQWTGDFNNWGSGIFQHHTGSAIDYSFKIRNGSSSTYNTAIYINSASKIGLGRANQSTSHHQVQGATAFGQFTNGTAVIDAYNGNAYFGCNDATNGIAIGSDGSISVAKNIVSNGYIRAKKTDTNPAIMVTNSGGGMRIQTYDLGADSQAYMGLGTDMGIGIYEHSLYFPATAQGKMTIGTFNGTTYSTKVWIDGNGDIRLKKIQFTNTSTGDITALRGQLFYGQATAGDYGVIMDFAQIGAGFKNFIVQGAEKMRVEGNLTSDSSIRGARLTVASANGSGSGISLYGTSADDVYVNMNGYLMPQFGMHFSHISKFGSHGGVTADWATYFTMDDTANRGWIFRCTARNLLSIDNSGNLIASGTLTGFTASDQRLKTNIQGINGKAMSVIRQLRGVEFDWNDTAFHHNSSLRNNPHSASYIAQEWEQVFPWATHSIYGQFKSIDKDILFPYITEGMIELDSEVSQLKRKVQQLESQVEQLKMRA